MVKIEPIDVREYALDIYRDFTLSARKNEPGAPKRIRRDRRDRHDDDRECTPWW